MPNAGVPPVLLTLENKVARIAGLKRSPVMLIVKRLRVIFYLLATIELVLVSLAWGRLPLH
jgi:hypothetical protein